MFHTEVLKTKEVRGVLEHQKQDASRLECFYCLRPPGDLAMSGADGRAAVGRRHYNGSQGRQIFDPAVITSWARPRGAFTRLEYAEGFQPLLLTVGDPQ